MFVNDIAFEESNVLKSKYAIASLRLLTNSYYHQALIILVGLLFFDQL